MANNRIKFNYREIDNVIAKTTEISVKPLASLLVQENLQTSLDLLEEEILNDPLSKELMAGTSLSKSNFIKGYFKNYGNNLFSFFGFEAGTKPVEDLITILRKRYTFKINKGKFVYGRNGQSKYIFKINIPTFDDIRSNTSLPWTKKSWIDAAEKGLTNIVNYLRKKGQGRSEYGIQIKNKVDKQFIPKSDYFFAKYQRFINRISGKK